MTKFTTQDADRLLGVADQFIEDWEKRDNSPECKERRAEWDAIRPLLVQAPALLVLLRDSLGTMSAMRTQIDQMSGLFEDEDGAIHEACDTHDEMQASISNMMTALHVPEPESKTLTGIETHYRVTWGVDVFAFTPRDAAQEALAIHRSGVTPVFEVLDDYGLTVVDLRARPPRMSGPG